MIMKKEFQLLVLLPIFLFTNPGLPLAGELDWYAQFPTFQGCSISGAHPQWVEFSGLHHLMTVNDLGEKPRAETFIISKDWDCSTTKFWLAFKQGGFFPEVEIEAVLPGGTERLLHRIVLTNVAIAAIETSFDPPTNVPRDRIRLKYERIQMESFCFRSGGTSCDSQVYCFDFALEAPC